MDRIEERVTALERKVGRYRNAAVALAVTLAGVVLVGATTGDVKDVVRTKKLVVTGLRHGDIL